jgi:hypothetical protein
MGFIKRFVLTILIALAVVAAVALLLPDRAHVERSIAIDAPPSKIFPFINNLREFNRWSPWFSRDPAAEYRYSQPASGKGARMSWHSTLRDVGNGSQTIVAVKRDEMVKTLLDFDWPGTAYATFLLAPVPDGSIVTWQFDVQFGFDLVGRCIGLFMDRWIGPDYEQGLNNLKRLAEAEQ